MLWVVMLIGMLFVLKSLICSCISLLVIGLLLVVIVLNLLFLVLVIMFGRFYWLSGGIVGGILNRLFLLLVVFGLSR